MENLKVAIIGQGRSGRDIHGRFFKSSLNDFCTVTAVCEKLDDRRSRAAEEYGCVTVDDYRNLIKIKDTFDIVVNASYSYQHYSITKELLENGINVLVEKPFSADAAQCRDLIDTAKKNGTRLLVFQQSLLNPTFKKVNEIVKSGKLGRLVSADLRSSGFQHRYDWQTLQCFLAGALYNTGPHPIGQSLELLGWDDSTRVSFASLRNENAVGDAEDYAKVILTNADGVTADIEISPCDTSEYDLFKIQGTNGTLTASGNSYKLKYIVDGEYELPTLDMESLRDADGHPMYCSEKLNFHEEEGTVSGSSFDAAVCEFYHMVYDTVMLGKEPFISPEMILHVVRVIDTAHKLCPLPRKFERKG